MTKKETGAKQGWKRHFYKRKINGLLSVLNLFLQEHIPWSLLTTTDS